MEKSMVQEEFLACAKQEQEKWISPVGRLILSAASIERSVNEILEVLAPEDRDTWRIEDFFKRAERISVISKEHLSDSLAESLKNHKRAYWKVMEDRNAIAHNPLFMYAFCIEKKPNVRAAIIHQRKNIEFSLEDVQKMADEAESVAERLMRYALNFEKSLNDEILITRQLYAAMHVMRSGESNAS